MSNEVPGTLSTVLQGVFGVFQGGFRGSPRSFRGSPKWFLGSPRSVSALPDVEWPGAVWGLQIDGMGDAVRGYGLDPSTAPLAAVVAAVEESLQESPASCCQADLLLAWRSEMGQQLEKIAHLEQVGLRYPPAVVLGPQQRRRKEGGGREGW